MSRRSAHPRAPRRATTPRRGTPHIAQPDPETPGVCAQCRRPLGRPNDMHIGADQLPAVDPDVTAAEHRKLGEREGDQ